jgi:predicted DNA-binding ribbon-helix-helix protein
MKTRRSLYIDDKLWEYLKGRAEKKNWSVSKLLVWLAEKDQQKIRAIEREKERAS